MKLLFYINNLFKNEQVNIAFNFNSNVNNNPLFSPTLANFVKMSSILPFIIFLFTGVSSGRDLHTTLIATTIYTDQRLVPKMANKQVNNIL